MLLLHRLALSGAGVAIGFAAAAALKHSMPSLGIGTMDDRSGMTQCSALVRTQRVGAVGNRVPLVPTDAAFEPTVRAPLPLLSVWRHQYFAVNA